MLASVELMQWIEQFGRCSVQGFVVKSRDMRDVLTYLKAERSLELAKVMPFVTSDSVSFQKRTDFALIAEESEMTQDLFEIKQIEVAMLEHEKGLIRIWLPKEHLECLFEKVTGV